MSDKLMFVIPIYLVDQDFEDEKNKNEDLGIPTDNVYKREQTALYTTHINSYWIDPGKDRMTGTKDIVFYIDGNSFRTPFSQKIINEVIHPAMHVRAALNEEQTNFITGPN